MSKLAVITGTSRGLGAALSSAFAAKGYSLLLLSRTTPSFTPPEAYSGNVWSSAISLSDTSTLEEQLGKAVAKVDGDFSEAVLINNAGTIGSTQATQNLTEAEIAPMIQLNLTSAFVLSSAFLRLFEHVPRRMIVDISSGAAVAPFKDWSLYCTVKAARHMHMRVVAAENDPASVKTLSYSPGVLATEMQKEIQRQNPQSETAKIVGSIISTENGVVPLEATSAELLAILEEDTYTSGELIDFYSRQPSMAPK